MKLPKKINKLKKSHDLKLATFGREFLFEYSMKREREKILFDKIKNPIY